MDSLLEDIKSSLSAPPPSIPAYEADVVMTSGTHSASLWDADGDVEANDIEFDDRGEGAGVEGDLDVDDE